MDSSPGMAARFHCQSSTKSWLDAAQFICTVFPISEKFSDPSDGDIFHLGHGHQFAAAILAAKEASPLVEPCSYNNFFTVSMVMGFCLVISIIYSFSSHRHQLPRIILLVGWSICIATTSIYTLMGYLSDQYNVWIPFFILAIILVSNFFTRHMDTREKLTNQNFIG